MVPRQGCRGSEPETWMSNVRVPYRLTVRALVEKHMQRAYPYHAGAIFFQFSIPC